MDKGETSNLVTVCYVHGGVVCIFETHRKEEKVIDGERGFGLPGLRQAIVLVVNFVLTLLLTYSLLLYK